MAKSLDNRRHLVMDHKARSSLILMIPFQNLEGTHEDEQRSCQGLSNRCSKQALPSTIATFTHQFSRHAPFVGRRKVMYTI